MIRLWLWSSDAKPDTNRQIFHECFLLFSLCLTRCTEGMPSTHSMEKVSQQNFFFPQAVLGNRKIWLSKKTKRIPTPSHRLKGREEGGITVCLKKGALEAKVSRCVLQSVRTKGLSDDRRGRNANLKYLSYFFQKSQKGLSLMGTQIERIQKNKGKKYNENITIRGVRRERGKRRRERLKKRSKGRTVEKRIHGTSDFD